MPTEKRMIDQIVIGERHRRDLGDLTDLTESIKNLGLLHPVVILPSGKLVAGARRLEAVKKLGRKEIDVTVADDLDSAQRLLEAERDENTCRMEMKPSEKAKLGMDLEELERPKAETRKRDGAQIGTLVRDGKDPSGKLPEGSKKHKHSETGEAVGAAIGMSRNTYYRAKKVVELAEAGNVSAIAEVAEMDRTGKVTPSYRRLIKGIPDAKRTGGIKKGSTWRDFDKPFEPKNQKAITVANKQYKRIGGILGTIESYCIAFPGVDVGAAVYVCNREEVYAWITILDDGIRALRTFRKRVQKEQKYVNGNKTGTQE